MYSVIVDGQVKDIKYKKMGLEFPSYNVFLGDVVIAQIFKSSKREWSVVVFGETTHLRKVDGFSNRERCVIYALRVLGYYKDKEPILLSLY